MIKHISHILGTFSLQFKILYAGLFALKRETIFFLKLTLYGIDMENITRVFEMQKSLNVHRCKPLQNLFLFHVSLYKELTSICKGSVRNAY